MPELVWQKLNIYVIKIIIKIEHKVPENGLQDLLHLKKE
jgi:hypothetical protein